MLQASRGACCFYPTGDSLCEQLRVVVNRRPGVVDEASMPTLRFRAMAFAAVLSAAFWAAVYSFLAG